MSASTTSAGTAHTLAFVRRQLPRRACRLLEIGCGDGELAAALASARCSVVAIDDDPAAVRKSRRRGVEARRAHWPDFDDGPFDVILFAHSLHHLDDLNAGIAHAIRQLRPGGRVVVEDFDFSAADHATAMWLHGVASGLSAAGALRAKHWLVSAMLDRRKSKMPIGAWSRDHRNLPGDDEVRSVLAATGLPLRHSVTEYLFRYVESSSPDVQEAVRRAEANLIAAGAIVALGRRFVLGR